MRHYVQYHMNAQPKKYYTHTKSLFQQDSVGSHKALHSLHS